MDVINRTLAWDAKYSVQVKELDDQHKQFLAIINDLIETAGTKPTKEHIKAIIKSLKEYADYHCAIEEKYFKEFNYENAKAHIAEHKAFGDKISELNTKDADDYFSLAFDVIDFLEDWWINHILVTDQAYVKCFKAHGLK
ncbi:MAG: bacteriohemerythrin [Prolixibacteraceae bacterium]|nr:bacteriohemerythrin [Prolixibacteraceae bacterium]